MREDDIKRTMKYGSDCDEETHENGGKQQQTGMGKGLLGE